MKTGLYGTRLYINQNYLASNIKHLQHQITGKNIIAMVKANAYGYGDIKISQALQNLGVNFFGVADFEEGINLRKSGITGRIMVMNPGVQNLEVIINYKLEPVVYSHAILLKICSIAKKKQKIPIHIKLNTGMNRWGFNSQEIPGVIQMLQNTKNISISSIYSHFPSAKKSKDDEFSMRQINDFQNQYIKFSKQFNYKIDTHIHNSFGLIRNIGSIKKFDFIRVGLALYGGLLDKDLKSIAELKCSISQIRYVQKGESIGYGRNFIAQRKVKIGIIPFGYADGLQRSWGNGILKFYYNNNLIPTIGDISMDSCTVDLSAINDINEGDDIYYFGEKRPIWQLAKELNTIPYEIMATLSRRIKRIHL
ncbi:MAG: alanine racemase [Flavobacteriales bacterium]|nr:alanine racemase [Flavobacteriales bacterium]|tara:strand:- start:19502 stop:20596 length:1095 start_codon:yes stop_codon:yes gene_type:complete